jgi:hypothetical protein
MSSRRASASGVRAELNGTLLTTALQACQLWADNPNVPLCVRRFDNGVLVVQFKTRDEDKVCLDVILGFKPMLTHTVCHRLRKRWFALQMSTVTG